MTTTQAIFQVFQGLNDKDLNDKDLKEIDNFYNQADEEYESKLFEIENELIDLQPNSAIGLYVVDQQIINEEAIIIEKYEEDGYCIAKFINGEELIYIPAQINTYNSFLKVGMNVTIQAFNTPGLIYPWRSKYVKIPLEYYRFNIKYNIPDSAGVIIGYGGNTIEYIKLNCLKNSMLPKPRINIYSNDNFNCTVEIVGHLKMFNLDFIKDEIKNVLQSNGIEVEVSYS
jgi:hypothetical protein